MGRWLWGLLLTVALAHGANTFVIAAGIEQYDDERISSLKYAAADARAVAAAFRAAGAGPRQVTLLTSDQSDARRRPTRINLLRALEKVKGDFGPDDKLVLFFAGHGVQVEGDQYLLTVDTQRSLIKDTSLPMRLVSEALRGLAEGEVLFLIDACRNDPNAGRADGDATLSDGLARGLRPHIVGPNDTALPRVQASLLACDIGERAWEDPDTHHGVFTTYLLKGLAGAAAAADRRVMLSGLARYVQTQVAAWGQRHGKQQTPRLVQDGPDMLVAVPPAEPLVSLSLAAQPLAEIVRQLAEDYGVQIVLGQGVDGDVKLTGKLDNLPLSTALRVLLAAARLTVRRDGPVYVIEGQSAPPSATAEPQPKLTLHVAPGGNDTAEGTADQPLASPQGARDALRRRRERGPTGPVAIRFQAGTYPLREPLVLGPQDGGTAAAPVVWAAAPGPRPVFSGGRRLSGWQVQADGLWAVAVPEAQSPDGFFQQLWVNGRRAARASSPAGDGFWLLGGPVPGSGGPNDPQAHRGFQYRAGDLEAREELSDAVVSLFHNWTNSVHWVDRVESDERVIRLTNAAEYAAGQLPEQRYRLENVRSGLVQPGTWYLSSREGRLYYRPLAGEQPDQTEAIAPVATSLLRLVGNPGGGQFVSYVTFRGLGLHHTDWRYPHTQALDGQAALFLDATIYATGARQCVFDDLDVGHGGGYGVWLAAGCQGNVIRHSQLHDLAGGGVRLGDAATVAGEELVERNTVENCFLHHLGRVFHGTPGVLVQKAIHSRIVHNEISDLFYTGISVGWTWGYAPSTARGNEVAYNHIHHLGWGLLNDMGGIYTLGVSPDTRLANNVIHDVLSFTYGGWGLYNDEGSSELVVENNLVYNTKSGSFHHHFGRDNLVRNNILAGASEAQLQRSRTEDHNSFNFERNIVWFTQGSLLTGNWSAGRFAMGRNLYWNPTDPPDFDGLTLDAWQAQGHDQGSRVADPLFVDPGHGDFRLRPGSPAYALGFKDLDLAAVGLTGEPAWRDLPRTLERPTMVFPADLAQPIRDDFETTAVGERPRRATVNGETGQARVRVTDETAASGRHSLKFTDAAGLPFVYDPHCFWAPIFRRGTIVESFDLRVGDGATAWHEWRSTGGFGAYKTGPSLKILPGGRLVAGGQELLTVPANQWIHFEVRTVIGPQASGTYRLSVTLPGRPPRVFPAVAAQDKLLTLAWLGFISEAPDSRVFYLDNLSVESLR